MDSTKPQENLSQVAPQPSANGHVYHLRPLGQYNRPTIHAADVARREILTAALPPPLNQLSPGNPPSKYAKQRQDYAYILLISDGKARNTARAISERLSYERRSRSLSPDGFGGSTGRTSEARGQIGLFRYLQSMRLRVRWIVFMVKSLHVEAKRVEARKQRRGVARQR